MSPTTNGTSSGTSPSRRWTIRWASAVTRWRDPLGAVPEGQRQADLDLVVTVELDRRQRLLLECWMEIGGARRALMAEREVTGGVRADGELLHIDARDGETLLLAASIDRRNHRLLFARTPLLQRAGFAAGSVDPPRMDAAAGQIEAASA